MSKVIEKQDYKKEFLKEFNTLCTYRHSWQVWADFVTASACALANSVDKGKHFEEREKEYAECVERLGGVEKASKLFAYVVMALEENPNQDFLGSLYMELNLGNHWKGQFFTPISVCDMMARVSLDNAIEVMENKGWAAINDPACGAGATLIATVNALKEKEIDYQSKALFVAQDIDRITGLMCFIQLSLLGCAGYIVIADTLCNPIVGKSALFIEEKPGQEIWYLPMFSNYICEGRRKWNLLDLLFAGVGAQEVAE